MQKTIITYIREKPIYRQSINKPPFNRKLLLRARSFRKRGIFSEVVFWKQVNKGGFYNIDFDRQKVIGNYIVDFYVKSLGLVVEIDGVSHNDKEEYDERRILYLQSLGLKVYTISDLRVKRDLDNVMNELEEYIVATFG